MKKTVLITGTSSGLGLSMAARLASRGYKVYAAMREIFRQDDLVNETRRREGISNLTVLKMDVVSSESIREAVAAVKADGNGLDVLVNNAGYSTKGFFEDLSDEDIRAQFDVNFFGALNVTREVLPLMRQRCRGLIINMSSMAVFYGKPASSAYVSSKCALEGFTESLAMELMPLGINVVLVEPGLYRTKILDNIRWARDFDNLASPYYEKSQQYRSFIQSDALKNRRDPEEIAVVVERLIESNKPRFRTSIGLYSKLLAIAVRVLPFRLYARHFYRKFFVCFKSTRSITKRNKEGDI
jgi:NAD(P)-dependent dehydrogenase (short-subunit alcohol dehydrogenase family)